MIKIQSGAKTMTINNKSFSASTSTDIEMLNLLLEASDFISSETFASYMGVEASELATAPIWAINYLSDILDANLTHLGYVMKDTKTDGMLGEYKDALLQLEKQNTELEPATTYITIKDEDIVTEQGTLKISTIVNILNIIKKLIV